MQAHIVICLRIIIYLLFYFFWKVFVFVQLNYPTDETNKKLQTGHTDGEEIRFLASLFPLADDRILLLSRLR